MSGIEDKIMLASMRPQPGTPTGEAWELGARQGWQWAADEIERLRDLADIYKWQVRDTCTRAENAEAEIDRLRAENAGLRNKVEFFQTRPAIEDAARSMRERAVEIAREWATPEQRQHGSGGPEAAINALPLIEDKAMSTPGENFADAANELIKGIQSIQFIVHRPLRADTRAHNSADMAMQLGQVAAICERLIGPYKIIIADLTREENQP